MSSQGALAEAGGVHRTAAYDCRNRSRCTQCWVSDAEVAETSYTAFISKKRVFPTLSCRAPCRAAAHRGATQSL